MVIPLVNSKLPTPPKPPRMPAPTSVNVAVPPVVMRVPGAKFLVLPPSIVKLMPLANVKSVVEVKSPVWVRLLPIVILLNVALLVVKLVPVSVPLLSVPESVPNPPVLNKPASKLRVPPPISRTPLLAILNVPPLRIKFVAVKSLASNDPPTFNTPEFRVIVPVVLFNVLVPDVTKLSVAPLLVIVPVLFSIVAVRLAVSPLAVVKLPLLLKVVGLIVSVPELWFIVPVLLKPVVPILSVCPDTFALMVPLLMMVALLELNIEP